MPDVKPPDFKFCPFCGKPLAEIAEEGKTRKRCLSCLWTHYPHVATAATAVIRDKDRVLLVQRAREPKRGLWMFPSGYLDYGENPEAAVVRETFEETGLKGEILRLIGVFQPEDDPREPGHIVFVYEIAVIPGPLQNDVEENIEARWFSLKNPPPIAWNLHRQLFQTLASRELNR